MGRTPIGRKRTAIPALQMGVMQTTSYVPIAERNDDRGFLRFTSGRQLSRRFFSFDDTTGLQ